MVRNRALALSTALALACGLSLPLRGDDPTAAAGTLSTADREALIAKLEAGRAETDALIAQAEGERFTHKPAADRWSVAEVLEHIGATEEALFGAVQGALAAEPDPEAAALLAANPIATFGATIEDRSQRFQAPDNLVPTGGKSREELISRYHAAREKTLELVRTTWFDRAEASFRVLGDHGRVAVVTEGGYHLGALREGLEGMIDKLSES